jgi:hypothetical protein
MTLAQAQAAAPRPVQPDVIGPCTYLVEAGGDRLGGLRVLFGRNGTVLGITAPDDAKTDTGIGVGGDFADVRAAYPGHPTEEGVSVGGTYLPVSGPGASAIGFRTRDRPIDTIAVGSPDFARGYELCSDSADGPPE